ncbi:DUF2007 domain-containing protein [Gayadomonas joobiniege]|uniref:putative signal transducing protein n=1 Tax=Gayadomonas joobiniege TaxID=1234606 RepID=UPI000363E07E|nr:DUF2007 domain-containing protein [Gayadomonas joobiniege]
MTNQTQQALVYQTDNSLQAHCIKGLLLQHGITAQLSGESLFGAIGELPANIQIEITVEHSEQARALEIIEKAMHSQQGQDWFCPQCGEKNAASFEVCWQCQTEKQENNND